MSRAVHQLAVHTVRDRESGVRAGRVTPPNRPFLEPSVRGRSRVWGAGNGPSGTVRPTVERLALRLRVDRHVVISRPGSLEARTFLFPLLVSADSIDDGESSSDGIHDPRIESSHAS